MIGKLVIWATMENFTPISGLLGGLLIGFSASLLLYTHHRICGISGIYSGFLSFKKGETLWRFTFILGLLCGGFVTLLFFPASLDIQIDKPFSLIILGGFLVGFGTNLGSGCTSGHGICGVGRLSLRSIIATCIFVFFGIATASILSFFYTGGRV